MDQQQLEAGIVHRPWSWQRQLVAGFVWAVTRLAAGFLWGVTVLAALKVVDMVLSR